MVANLTPNAIRVREFHQGDELALHEVFYSAIHNIAIRDYSTEQVNAWAPRELDHALWTTKISSINPFVAIVGDEIVGYADLQANGYIDHFFVSGTHPQQGIGRMLMEHIFDIARQRSLTELSAHVSLTAQAFFEYFGFVVVEHRSPVIKGIILPNAAMRKTLRYEQAIVTSPVKA